MKKKLLGLVLGTVACLTMGVNAKELDAPSLGVDGLCMTSQDNSVIISFKLGESITSHNDYSIMFRSLEGDTLHTISGNNIGTMAAFKKVNSVTCEDNVEGTDIADGNSIGAGDTIYIKYTDVDTSKKLYFLLSRPTFEEFGIVYDASKDEFPYFSDMVLYKDTDEKIKEYASSKYQDYLFFETQCYNCSPYLYLKVGKDETNLVPIGGISYYNGINTLGFNGEGSSGRTFEETKTSLDNLIKNWKPNLEWINSDVENGFTSSLKDALKSVGALKGITDATTTTLDKLDNNNKILYSWSFDNSKVAELAPSSLDIKLGDSSEKDKVEALLDKETKYLMVEFSHHGELPEETKIKFNVQDKYSNNDKITLYYYNPDANKLEKETESEVVDGFVEFDIKHCSTHVMVKGNAESGAANETVETKDNNAQTAGLNTIFYSVLAISSLVGLIYFSVRRKQNN